MDYILLKQAHIVLAVTTLLSFIIRGYWMITDSSLLQHRWVKTIPHIIDTLLLSSALALMVMAGFYPWVFDWVAAKILLLLLYIVFGTIALKRGKTKSQRIVAFIAALICIGLIFKSALSKFML
ncbi:SirB2 family protein [Pseudidiomarina taiwanensis]|uniref:Invasion protein n=1 Tax=Pseudidiomarina taiwanensis TaxID=337250 RepID=A0A432ZEU8_9GAMM|nr:SirB2 family protein [Pseudidiomarina taiwanensis]RUO76463.1 invasion protein [Pseudidiomarina taiwanensis]